MILTAIIFGAIAVLLLITGITMLFGRGGLLLSGWNTMDPQKKATYNQIAFLRFHGLLFIIMALTFAAGAVGMYFDLVLMSLVPLLAVIITIPASIYAFNSGRFRIGGIKPVNPPMTKTKKIALAVKIALVAISMIILGVFMLYSIIPPNVNILDNGIQITGSYGITIDFSDIDSISLIEQSIAEIGPGVRTNGFAAGNVLRGHFMLGRLFIMNSQMGPTIRIDRESGVPIFISFSDSSTTRQVYQEIRLAFP